MVFTPNKELDDEIKLEEGNGRTSEHGASKNKAYDESLIFAMEKTFRRQFWVGGFLLLVGGASLFYEKR